MLLNKPLCVLTAIAFIFHSLSANAGTQVLATRLIFFSNKKEASVQVENADGEPVLIQSWIDPYQTNDDDKPNNIVPFFAMPPLSRLDTKQRNTVRIRRSNQALPEDRESVFWLNIKEIPQKAKTENILQFAVNTRLKLFFRPAHLTVCANQAYQQLQWQVLQENHSSHIRINNPTPCFITLAEASINQTQPLSLNPTSMVAPFSSISYSFNTISAKEIHDISYRTINDYGALTPPVTTAFPATANIVP